MSEDPLLKGTIESRICPLCNKIVNAEHDGYSNIVLVRHPGKKYLVPCAGSRLSVEGQIIITEERRGLALARPTEPKLVQQTRREGTLDSFQ